MSSQSEAISPSPAAPFKDRRAAKQVKQLVTFSIGPHRCCVDILCVSEIRVEPQITQLPSTRDFLWGVINLRGVIIPILDMHARFGLGRHEVEKSNVVIVVTIGTGLYGLLADSVSDIITISSSEIAPVPEVVGQSQCPWLEALISYEDQLLGLIALDRFLSDVGREWGPLDQQQDVGAAIVARTAAIAAEATASP